MTDIVTAGQLKLPADDFGLGRPVPTVLPRARLVLVDDDYPVRATLEQSLIDADFEVRGFSTGMSALSYLLGGPDVDVVLLDWKMPVMAGIEVLRSMRSAGLTVPVIFLTGLTDPALEETALTAGAVDFVEKARSFSILIHRINLIVGGAKPQAAADGSSNVQVGHLELRRDVFLAYWRGHEMPLTLTEFKILDILVTQRGDHVSYRTIYDIVHGKDFMAGSGAEGYRANVRTFIKRIRRKFRDLDDSWDLIENYAGFGYRWVGGVGATA
jgi:two-component system, OmpR family, response regulator ChvI